MEYATHEDMRAAMKKLDGTDLNGRKLRLTEDYRSGGGGGGGRRRRYHSFLHDFYVSVSGRIIVHNQIAFRTRNS